MHSCSWPSARALRTLAVAGGVLISAVSCGGSGSGTSPSANTTPLAPNPCPQSQGCPSIDSIGFWIRIQANTNGAPGPWSFTFNEKDYNGSGNTEYGFINAQPGDYEIRGQFSTTAFNVELGRQGGGRGGVLVSSVQSPEGPSTPSNQCSVNYFTQTARTTPQTFRVKFTVVAGTNGTC